VSSQPAGLVKSLRANGFIFQNADNKKKSYFYRNSKGEICRKIIGYKQPVSKLSRKLKSLLDKSVAACVSAIEIYNKPDFKYREESFSILMVNAWELLIKAKLINDRGGVSAIQEFSNGKARLNRAGNFYTIDISRAANMLIGENKLDVRCWANIELLIEVRDNAIHFYNKGKDLGKKVLEIGTASLSNYLIAIGDWFSIDLSQFNFFLMPMSFFHQWEIESSSILKASDKNTERLVEYLRKIESEYPPEEDNPYAIAVRVQTKFVKTYSDRPSIDVRFTNDESAPLVRIAEEDVYKNKYTLEYNELVKRLRERYPGFKQNDRFYNLKRKLEAPENNERYCKIRYLNPRDNKGTKRLFYNPEILKEFDKEYSKKT